MDAETRDVVKVVAEDVLLLGILGIAAWRLEPPAFMDVLALVLLGARTGVKLGFLDKFMPPAGQ